MVPSVCSILFFSSFVRARGSTTPPLDDSSFCCHCNARPSYFVVVVSGGGGGGGGVSSVVVGWDEGAIISSCQLRFLFLAVVNNTVS